MAQGGQGVGGVGGLSDEHARRGVADDEAQPTPGSCRVRCRRPLNDKAHRPSFLRLASSLDCHRCRTVSTGTETPVRWYSSDAACARAWNVDWTRLNAMAFCTVASTNSLRVSPCRRTDSSSTRNFGWTRISGMTADFMKKAYCDCVAAVAGLTGVPACPPARKTEVACRPGAADDEAQPGRRLLPHLRRSTGRVGQSPPAAVGVTGARSSCRQRPRFGS